MWPAQRPVVGVEAGRRPVGRPAIAQPAGPPVLFRRQFGTCSLGATGRASAPRGLRQGKANVRKDTERSVAAERSRHSRRSLPTLLHCRRCGHRSQTSASGVEQPRSGRLATADPDRPAFVVVRASRRRLHRPCSARQAGGSAPSDDEAPTPALQSPASRAEQGSRRPRPCTCPTGKAGLGPRQGRFPRPSARRCSG